MVETALHRLAHGVRVPVSVLTGFLGSGKTTLLNRLLRDPGMADCVVLVNELGEIGIDHLVVQEIHENVVLLESGCLCCAVRSDLVEALRLLSIQSLRGEVPPFRRVVIETTGLADPVPVIHTLMTDPLLTEQFRLDGFVTTVDAGLGEAQLVTFSEAVRQAVVADRIVLTKLDVNPDSAPRLTARLKALNAGALLLDGRAATAEQLFDVGAYDPSTKSGELLRWLAAVDKSGQHEADVRSLVVRADRPLDWAAFSDWLTTLLSTHGPDILRVKGIVDVAGRDRPVIINGVQHIFYPVEELESWPAGQRCSRIVFTMRDLPFSVISTAFRQRFGVPPSTAIA